MNLKLIVISLSSSFLILLISLTLLSLVFPRTRYEAKGNGLLFLTPSEKPMMDILTQHKIPLKTLKVNAKQRERSIQGQLQSFIAADPELKYLAQRVMKKDKSNKIHVYL